MILSDYEELKKSQVQQEPEPLEEITPVIEPPQEILQPVTEYSTFDCEHEEEQNEEIIMNTYCIKSKEIEEEKQTDQEESMFSFSDNILREKSKFMA